MSEQELRARVVAEALSWMRTPFVDCAGIKGQGTDCAHMPYMVYQALGLLPRIELPRYSAQFLLHKSEEIYLRYVTPYCVETAEPQPGDLAMWKFARCFSHGGLITSWPNIVHAWKPAGAVIVDDALRNKALSFDGNGRQRPVRFYTLKSWEPR